MLLPPLQWVVRMDTTLPSNGVSSNDYARLHGPVAVVQGHLSKHYADLEGVVLVPSSIWDMDPDELKEVVEGEQSLCAEPGCHNPPSDNFILIPVDPPVVGGEEEDNPVFVRVFFCQSHGPSYEYEDVI